tara:strand:+ start:3635 stop:3766 length:132 start_codon:yes stop_codon:yes gene_type:complete
MINIFEGILESLSAPSNIAKQLGLISGCVFGGWYFREVLKTDY